MDKTGSVLCVIEAINFSTEIERRNTGRIVKILVENAKPVEYDQRFVPDRGDIRG